MLVSPFRRDRWLFILINVVILVVVCLVLVQPSDGFKLTASSASGTSRGDKVAANTWRKTPRVRDVLQKVQLSTKLNRDDDDDNNAREDDDDDEEDEEDEPEYKFEKVHHSDVKRKPQDQPSQRTKVKFSKLQSEPDDNDDDDDDDDDDEDESMNPAWWNFYGLFSKKKGKFLSVIESVRESENEEIRKEVESEPLNGNLWKSYLNRKPFNLFFDFDDDDDDDKDDNGDKSEEVKSKKHKEETKTKDKPKGPLSADDFEDMLLYLPSFVPNYTNVENLDCRRQGQIFQRQLRGQKLWAFQMLDATGKINSGLLQGNINQLGNYDLCTDIATRVKVTEKDSVRIQGKYCLASVELQAEEENLKLPLHLIQGKSLLRSSISDPSHFLPRFTVFDWGICVPAACSATDIEDYLEDTLENYNATGVSVLVQLEDEDCYVKKTNNWNNLLKTEWELTATVAGVCFILVIAALATMNDCWTQWKRAAIVIEIVDGDEEVKESENIPAEGTNPEPLETVNQVLMAFSLRQTLRDLVHLRDGEIGCIHGLKAIASLAIFFTFKTLQIVRLPWSNRISLTETLDNPTTVLLRSPLLSMDTFLVLSGILVAYSTCRDFETHGHIRWIRRILGRVLRLLPLLSLSTLFIAWIWPHLGSGPLWGDIVEDNSDLCQDSSWKNFVFLNNWDDVAESCSPHTTQLAVEFQLFLLSPIVIWLMYRSPVMGLGLFGLLHAFSAATRFSATQQNRLSPWIFHGMKLTQIYRTINLSFGTLLHRVTPYMGGLGLGMMLFQTGTNVRLSKGIMYGGWASCILSFAWCIGSQWDITRRDYVYDPTDVAKSSAWSPLIWTIAINWIVFACHTGNGGILNEILSAKAMIFLSRISYAMYFVEFIVLNTSAATVQHPDAFGLSDFLDWVEIGAIIVSATILALIFDLPLHSVKALLFSAVESEGAGLSTISQTEVDGLDGTKEVSEEIEDVFGGDDEHEELPKRKIQFYAEQEDEEAEEPEGHGGGEEATDDIWGTDEREEFIRKKPSYVPRYNYTAAPEEDHAEPAEDEEVEEEEEEEDEEEIEEEKEIVRKPRRW